MLSYLLNEIELGCLMVYITDHLPDVKTQRSVAACEQSWY